MNGNPMMLIGSACISISSTIVYPVSQKSIPAHVHPFVSVVSIFPAALAVSILIAFMTGGFSDLKTSGKHFHRRYRGRTCSVLSFRLGV